MYIGPAVKRVEIVSDKMPDIMLIDQPCGIIARNFSDPKMIEIMNQMIVYICSWSRYSTQNLSTT